MKNFINRLQYRLQKARSRRQLLTLSEEQLKDIGVTRKQAEMEAKKGYWN